MQYCKTCIIPSTRPNIQFDENGHCNCATLEKKQLIDWNAREQLFRKVVEHAKKCNAEYDCVIPVSGGKDSTWQVVKCLEYGLTPLAVTWKTPARTPIGSKNLENLISLGVDHIDYQVNPKVEKKFMYEALVQYGTPAIPMHMALFNIPLKIAVKFNIPLVVWGENSAFEYGGSEDEQRGFKLTRQWLQKYGVNHGTTAKDWISSQLSEKELTPYFGPSEEELQKADIHAVFLGYYFMWDPQITYEVARAHGFQAEERARTGLYDFADIDDDFISIHHYLKWYKFGFTRLFDNLSLEIRNGRMTRDQALETVRSRGDETPYEDIEKFCKFIGITKEHFFDVIEKFRNRNIWIKESGKWKIKDFIIPDWNWG